MVRSHLMRGLRLCGLGGQLVNEKSHGGMAGGIPVPVWALCPAAWVTFGTSLTPALDCSSTMNGWAKKSRVILNSGKHVMSRKNPFLIYHTSDHWLGVSN